MEGGDRYEMSPSAVRTDVSQMPDVLALAEEVARTGIPHLLERAEQTLAIISPLRPNSLRRRRVTPRSGHESLLSAFGAWKDSIDPEAMKRMIRDGREDGRPRR